MRRKTVLVAMLLAIGSVFSPTLAGAVPIKWRIHHHGVIGGRYCPFAGCCCLKSLDVGTATNAELAQGFGNVNADVVPSASSPTGKALHIVFLSQPTFAPDPEGPSLTVDGAWPLLPRVAHALGYANATLQPGLYPYNAGSSTYGDLFIDVAVGPAADIPAIPEWGALILVLLLLGMGAMYAHLRRSARAAD
jgi:hypothetical protein